MHTKRYIHKTHVCLIPKIKGANTLKDYRPISLCNITYKIITKIISNRLKPIMNTLIGPCQSSFLKNRQATDNAIIVQETMTHFQKMKGKNVSMILKIDLEKAFDKIEWSFIRNTLIYFGFAHNIINLIMSCVSTSSISILVNGDHTEFFQPSRGIRQGDPMSP